MPRPYPPEFRQRALDLVRSGRSVPEVGELLRWPGVPPMSGVRGPGREHLRDRRSERPTGQLALMMNA